MLTNLKEWSLSRERLLYIRDLTWPYEVDGRAMTLKKLYLTVFNNEKLLSCDDFFRWNNDVENDADF